MAAGARGWMDGRDKPDHDKPRALSALVRPEPSAHARILLHRAQAGGAPLDLRHVRGRLPESHAVGKRLAAAPRPARLRLARARCQRTSGREGHAVCGRLAAARNRGRKLLGQRRDGRRLRCGRLEGRGIPWRRRWWRRGRRCRGEVRIGTGRERPARPPRLGCQRGRRPTSRWSAQGGAHRWGSLHAASAAGVSRDRGCCPSERQQASGEGKRERNAAC
jgi:hypothetical protein